MPPSTPSPTKITSPPPFNENSNQAINFLLPQHKRLCPYAFQKGYPCPQGSNCLGVGLCRQFAIDGKCEGGLDCAGGAHELPHCYDERDNHMCDTIYVDERTTTQSADYKVAVKEHMEGFWHMRELEQSDKVSVSRRVLDGKVDAHLRGEYLVKADVWGQGWVILYGKDGWYVLRVGRVNPKGS
ncbi:hypothetical protein GLAREA_06838 [Glarea lozoyensis ATCC 20868]|uniref:Uncharacterized protein n=1 Tax=Glarea lozoyensis (strain ATCC 20868 / MF5171) TaxID=1116229 RepID=S3D7W3_GLAL2|nr:uncharacterized protein GLAREA_06838 [Glarea lozoyensis ATCC 20868]EPE33825.1 hypothetical protein GLAREA_06838 [Glarea lozoyensis ATCC 20868]